MADEPKWTLNARGNLAIYRATAYGVAIVGVGIGVRLEFEAPPGEKQEVIQALLTVEDALGLAELLQEKAALALKPPPDASSRQ